MRGFLLVSIYNFNIVIRRVKLKRVLDRAECAAVIPKARLSVFLGGHRRILKPAFLMCVVHPAADDISILELHNRISDIAAVIFSPSRHRESCKDIGICLLTPKNTIISKSLISKEIVWCSEYFPIIVIQYAAGHFAVRGPSLRNTLICRPKLNCLRTIKSGINSP